MKIVATLLGVIEEKGRKSVSDLGMSGRERKKEKPIKNDETRKIMWQISSRTLVSKSSVETDQLV